MCQWRHDERHLWQRMDNWGKRLIAWTLSSAKRFSSKIDLIHPPLSFRSAPVDISRALDSIGIVYALVEACIHVRLEEASSSKAQRFQSDALPFSVICHWLRVFSNLKFYNPSTEMRQSSRLRNHTPGDSSKLVKIVLPDALSDF